MTTAGAPLSHPDECPRFQLLFRLRSSRQNHNAARLARRRWERPEILHFRSTLSSVTALSPAAVTSRSSV